MKDNTNESQLDELFRDQLSQANASVPPGTWEAVSSGIGASTAATTAVQSAIWMKAAIGATILLTAGIGYYLSSSEATIPQSQNPPSSQLTEPNNNVEQIAQNRDEKLTDKPVSKSNNNFIPVVVEGEELLMAPDEEIYNVIDVAHAVEEPYKIVHSDLFKDNALNDIQVDTYTSSESDEFAMTIKDLKPAVIDSAFINVPDAVTPNGDGFNDTYLIQLVGEEFVNITIYDAAGEIVFSTKNKYQAWNCTLPNGELAPVGKYFVRVEYKFKNQAPTRPIISPLTLNI